MQPNNVSFLSGMNRFRTGSYKTILIPKKWTPECYVKVVTLIIGIDWDYNWMAFWFFSGKTGINIEGRKVSDTERSMADYVWGYNNYPSHGAGWKLLHGVGWELLTDISAVGVLIPKSFNSSSV